MTESDDENVGELTDYRDERCFLSLVEKNPGTLIKFWPGVINTETSQEAQLQIVSKFKAETLFDNFYEREEVAKTAFRHITVISAHVLTQLNKYSEEEKAIIRSLAACYLFLHHRGVEKLAENNQERRNEGIASLAVWEGDLVDPGFMGGFENNLAKRWIEIFSDGGLWQYTHNAFNKWSTDIDPETKERYERPILNYQQSHKNWGVAGLLKNAADKQGNPYYTLEEHSLPEVICSLILRLVLVRDNWAGYVENQLAKKGITIRKIGTPMVQAERARNQVWLYYLIEASGGKSPSAISIAANVSKTRWSEQLASNLPRTTISQAHMEKLTVAALGSLDQDRRAETERAARIFWPEDGHKFPPDFKYSDINSWLRSLVDKTHDVGMMNALIEYHDFRDIGVDAPIASELREKAESPVDLYEKDGDFSAVQFITIKGVVEAGVPQEAIEMPVDEFEKEPLIPLSENVFEGELYGLVVRGDSMNLVFPADTVLICRPFDPNTEQYPLDKYVIAFNPEENECTCKKLVRDETFGGLVLKPMSNRMNEETGRPYYQDIHLNAAWPGEIQGVVVEAHLKNL